MDYIEGHKQEVLTHKEQEVILLLDFLISTQDIIF